MFKLGFSHFGMEFSPRFAYSKMVIPALFRDLIIGFPAFEMALVPYQECGNQYHECGNSKAPY